MLLNGIPGYGYAVSEVNVVGKAAIVNYSHAGHKYIDLLPTRTGLNPSVTLFDDRLYAAVGAWLAGR